MAEILTLIMECRDGEQGEDEEKEESLLKVGIARTAAVGTHVIRNILHLRFSFLLRATSKDLLSTILRCFEWV